MRFLFKTSYEQDIRLFRDASTASGTALLAVVVLALPVLLSRYYVGEITWVFIYGICGVSLMVLVGYTGLVSLGHAAFLGIGAYAHAYFLQHGVPWVASVALAVVITTACGIVVGLPALRMTGIYLAIATLAFAVIIQEVFTPLGVGDQRLRRHGGRQAGDLRRSASTDEAAFYYLCAVLPGGDVLWLTRNLLRSPTGRAWVAIRDSEIAAQSMGVQPGGLQVDRLRLLGGADGPGRRAVRAQDRLSRAGHLHHPAVDPVAAAGDRGRARLAAWRCVRRDLRGPAAADHRHPAQTRSRPRWPVLPAPRASA